MAFQSVNDARSIPVNTPTYEGLIGELDALRDDASRVGETFIQLGALFSAINASVADAAELAKLGQSVAAAAADTADNTRDYVFELVHRANAAIPPRFWRTTNPPSAPLTAERKLERRFARTISGFPIDPSEACLESWGAKTAGRHSASKRHGKR